MREKMRRSRKTYIRNRTRTFQLVIFCLTIGFAGGVFFPLFHIRELRGVRNQLQDRAESLDRVIEAVRNGVFSPATVTLFRKIGSKAINRLIEILENESIPSLERQHAAIMLGLIGDKRAIPTLVDVLESCDDSSLRAQITSSLGRIGDESTVPYLEKLVNDTDEEVRLSAIEAMSRIGGIKVATIFARTLENALERMPEEIISAAPKEDMEWWFYYARIRKLGSPSIRQFQRAVGIEADGIIGPRTKKAADEAYKEKTGLQP